MLRSLLGLVACGLVLGGCAAAMSPGARSAKDPGAREPTTIDEANEQIRLAERELTGDRDERAKAPSAAGAVAAPAAPEPPASPSPRAHESSPAEAQRSQAKAGREAESADASPTPCERACRALQSMTVAVSSLCRMTGPEDARCNQAKTTLEKSRESAKLRACGCM